MNLEKYMLPCLFKTLFGIECLGCGFQHALFLLFKGEFFEAFKTYPAIYSTLLFLGFSLFCLLDQTKKNQKRLLFFALLNFAFMIVGYYYKSF